MASSKSKQDVANSSKDLPRKDVRLVPPPKVTASSENKKSLSSGASNGKIKSGLHIGRATPSSLLAGSLLKVPISIIRGSSGIKEQEVIVHPRAPDGGWGWMVVLGSFYINMLLDGISISLTVKATSFQNEFQDFGKPHSVSEIAWVISLFSAFTFIGGPLAAALVQKFGFRVVAILGSMISACSMLLSYYINRETPNLASMLVLNGVMSGIGYSFMYIPSIVIVGFYFEKRRALAASIAVTGSGVGQFIFPLLITYIVDTWGWRTSMVLEAGMTMGCGLAGALFRPLQPENYSAPSPEPNTNITADSAGANNADENLRILETIKKLQEDSTVAMASTDHQVEGGGGGGASTHFVQFGGFPEEKPGGGGASAELQRTGSGSFGSFDPSSGFKTSLIKSSSGSGGDPFLSSRVTLLSQSVIPQRTQSAFLSNNRSIKSAGSSLGSQPTLNDPVSGRFFRHDMFFTGSVQRVPVFSETAVPGGSGSGSGMNEGAVLISRQMASSVDEDQLALYQPRPANKRANKSRCECFRNLRTVRGIHVISQMLQCNLLTSITFVMVIMAATLVMSGFYIPYMYMEGIATQNGMTARDARVFLSCIGGANTLGRIVCGLIADSPRVNVCLLYSLAMISAGSVTMLLPFLKIYSLYVTYGIVLGLSYAFYVSLNSIVLVELLGLENLTNAFGLFCLFQGGAAMLGTPMAGLLYDVMGKYDFLFFVAGAMFLSAGLVLAPIRCVGRWELQRKKIL